MKLGVLGALIGITALTAAEECADVPLCVRVGTPKQVFFVGEATDERQREGRKPEYRFQVREVLLGIAPETETVVVETAEGTPPTGLLLLQARLLDDGNLERGECDYAAPDTSAQQALQELRGLRSAKASLTVKVVDVRGRNPEDLRIKLDGPMSRLADREARFGDLAPGRYRLTASAPGYQTKSEEKDVLPGACPVVEIKLAGTGEIAGGVTPPEEIQAVDAEGIAVAASAMPSDQGRYRLGELPPGRYVLTNGTAYYPGARSRADAVVIHLGPGQKVEINHWNLR